VFVALLEQGLTANALQVSIDALSVTLITKLMLQWPTAGQNFSDQTAQVSVDVTSLNFILADRVTHHSVGLFHVSSEFYVHVNECIYF
jgi:hypothetical protein